MATASGNCNYASCEKTLSEALQPNADLATKAKAYKGGEERGGGGWGGCPVDFGGRGGPVDFRGVSLQSARSLHHCLPLLEVSTLSA